MEIQFSFTIGAAAVVLFCALCFIGTTVFCWMAGMFDGSGGTYGIEGLFVILFYAVFWVAPSLLAWAVWATWFRVA